MTLPPFSAWVGPKKPKTLFVGEAWGADEAPVRQPFVGESGKEFWRILGEVYHDIEPEEHSRVSDLHRFGSAWIRDRQPWMEATSIAFTNVFNLRPMDNKIPALCCKKSDLPLSYSFPDITRGLYLRPEFLPELDRLESEITEAQPNLIVALGNTACWALLRTGQISSIRGTATFSVLRNSPQTFKVLPTYHPASVLYQWSNRPIVVADLMKARREAEFPDLRRPSRSILISPTIEQWKDFTYQTLQNPPPLLGNDLETTAGMIDTVGFAPSKQSSIVCMVGPHRYKVGTSFDYFFPIRDGKKVSSYFTHNEEVYFWQLCFQLMESSIPKLFQNGLYDLQYWLKLGCRPNNILEDTMLLQHSMFPEMQKSLGFLGSIYTNEASWKLMRKHKKGDSEKRDE